MEVAKKQQLKPDMEQQTGSKLGKESVKSVYCQGCIYPTYLTYMQSASCKMPGWMKHKLESRLLGACAALPQDSSEQHPNMGSEVQTDHPLSKPQ